ncbi:MAG: leucine-rich repeat domain-containing protein [Paludibacteraceae bacterium]|nr:leucine-rich repeat domain-containing protein [Paludibacteraceae bacterium]
MPLSLKGKVPSNAFPSTCVIEWYGKEETAIPVDQTGLKFTYDYRNMTASVTGVYNKEVTSVEIPYKVSYVNKEYDVTSIGASAFVNCTSLTSINIPNSVTSIGEAAFSGCAAITSIEIPESVTTIGMTAFMNCTSLTSINIPNSVTTIGANAFSGCTNLTSIEIPSSVTTIGANAFWSCESLTSINIPNSVTTIGDDAFKDCDKLKTARVPSSLKGMVESAFPSTCEIVWYDPLTGETLEKGLIFKYNATTMTASVTGFENKTVTEVIIPSVVLYGGKEYVVTSIGESAFLSSNNLTSIVIPNTVTSIGNTAFSMCAGLTSIEIPNSVTTIGMGAFTLSPLTSIVIPESVTTIGENAFLGCLKLETAFVPSSLEGKVESAFPSNCEIKWYDASADQTGLEFCWYVDSYDFAFAYVCGVENKEVDSVTIPYKVLYNGRVYLVTTIASYAYSGCQNLTSIEIPKTITHILGNAFTGCANLRSAYVPKGCIISTDSYSPSFPSRCVIQRY